VTQLGNLLWGFDVAPEERDAAQLKLTRQRPHLGCDGRGRQASDEQLSDLAS
jgi:hypothetical protein